jgi:GntR family transcriptional regulator
LIEEAATLSELEKRYGKIAESYRYLKRVHSRNGVAYCVISVYLDVIVFKLAPKRFRRETVILVLLELPQVEITEARQTLGIAVADTEVANFLEIPLNLPVAEVRRVFTGPDRTALILGEINYRGYYVHLEMNLIPEGNLC